MFDVEALDPFDPEYPHLWVKLEHLARYLFAADRFQGAGLVLDVACGTGYGARELAARGVNVVAVDLPEQIEAVREASWPVPEPRYPARRVNRRAYTQYLQRHERRPERHLQEVEERITWVGLNLDEESLSAELNARFAGGVDAVCCFETLEHVRRPRKLMRELAACLKPGGTHLLSAPRAINEPVDSDGKPKNPYHQSVFTRDEVEELLCSSGFRVEGVFGQALCNLMFRREMELLSDTGRGPSEFHPTRPRTLRHYARLFAYPSTDQLEDSYALLWLARWEE